MVVIDLEGPGKTWFHLFLSLLPDDDDDDGGPPLKGHAFLPPGLTWSCLIPAAPAVEVDGVESSHLIRFCSYSLNMTTFSTLLHDVIPSRKSMSSMSMPTLYCEKIQIFILLSFEVKKYEYIVGIQKMYWLGVNYL